MKKILYLAVIVLTAAVFTGCGYKSVENRLNEELISFTAMNSYGDTLWGVKDNKGNTIIPAQYDNISICAENILAQDGAEQWLYAPDGTLWFEEASNPIAQEKKDLIFYFKSGKVYRFIDVLDSQNVTPLNSCNRFGSKYLFAQDENGLGCTVYNQNGDVILYGEWVIYLIVQDKPHFITVDLEGRAFAYDEKGEVLFELERDKIQYLPIAEWIDLCSLKIVTQQPLSMFK